MAEVSSRYARAFIEVVFDSKLDATRISEQLREFVALFQSSEDLRRVWESPAVPAEQKRKLLDSILAKMSEVPRCLRNFMAVLIDHGRIVQLPEIAKQFEGELNARLGRVQADVVSARELSSAERQQLLAEMLTVIGQQVIANYTIDQALIGGALVKLGSTVYDGSVRRQLQKIKEQLSAE